MAAGLGPFKGVERRFQGSAKRPAYGRGRLRAPPQEIRGRSPRRARAYPGRRIVVAFQPHLFTRRETSRRFGARSRAHEFFFGIYPRARIRSRSHGGARRGWVPAAGERRRGCA